MANDPLFPVDDCSIAYVPRADFNFVQDCAIPPPVLPVPIFPPLHLPFMPPPPLGGGGSIGAGSPGPRGPTGPTGPPGLNGLPGPSIFPTSSITLYEEQVRCVDGLQIVYQRPVSITSTSGNLGANYGDWYALTVIGCCDTCAFESLSSLSSLSSASSVHTVPSTLSHCNTLDTDIEGTDPVPLRPHIRFTFNGVTLTLPLTWIVESTSCAGNEGWEFVIGTPVELCPGLTVGGVALCCGQDGPNVWRLGIDLHFFGGGINSYVTSSSPGSSGLYPLTVVDTNPILYTTQTFVPIDIITGCGAGDNVLYIEIIP